MEIENFEKIKDSVNDSNNPHLLIKYFKINMKNPSKKVITKKIYEDLMSLNFYRLTIKELKPSFDFINNSNCLNEMYKNSNDIITGKRVYEITLLMDNQAMIYKVEKMFKMITSFKSNNDKSEEFWYDNYNSFLTNFLNNNPKYYDFYFLVLGSILHFNNNLFKFHYKRKNDNLCIISTSKAYVNFLYLYLLSITYRFGFTFITISQKICKYDKYDLFKITEESDYFEACQKITYWNMKDKNPILEMIKEDYDINELIAMYLAKLLENKEYDDFCWKIMRFDLENIYKKDDDLSFNIDFQNIVLFNTRESQENSFKYEFTHDFSPLSYFGFTFMPVINFATQILADFNAKDLSLYINKRERYIDKFKSSDVRYLFKRVEINMYC